MSHASIQTANGPDHATIGTSYLREIRDNVAAAINASNIARKVVSIPYRNLTPLTEDLPYDRGGIIVSVTGAAMDETILSRASKERRISLTVFVEKRVDSTVQEQIEECITQLEDIMTVCSNLDGWTANNAARDEHGTPFLYNVLSNHALFQAVFHPVYFQRKAR